MKAHNEQNYATTQSLICPLHKCHITLTMLLLAKLSSTGYYFNSESVQ